MQYILCHIPTYIHLYFGLSPFIRTDSPAHLVTGCDVVHYKPAPLPVPGNAVDAVDHFVNVLNPKLCEQLGRHFVYLNQVLIITINHQHDIKDKRCPAQKLVLPKDRSVDDVFPC